LLWEPALWAGTWPARVCRAAAARERACSRQGFGAVSEG
jgi:hypothetical protein